jgi:hypothetical protein
MCFDPNIDLYSSFFLHIMLELKSIEFVQWVLQKKNYLTCLGIWEPT